MSGRAHLGSLRGTARFVRASCCSRRRTRRALMPGISLRTVRRTKHRGRRDRVALRARTRAGARGAERHRGPGSLPQRRREDAGRGQALFRGDREQGPALLLYVRGRSRDRGLARARSSSTGSGSRSARSRWGCCSESSRAPRAAVVTGFLVYPLASDERLVSRGPLDARRARVRAVDPVGLAPRAVRRSGRAARGGHALQAQPCGVSPPRRSLRSSCSACPRASRLRHAVRAGGGSGGSPARRRARPRRHRRVARLPRVDRGQHALRERAAPLRRHAESDARALRHRARVLPGGRTMAVAGRSARGRSGRRPRRRQLDAFPPPAPRACLDDRRDADRSRS